MSSMVMVMSSMEMVIVTFGSWWLADEYERAISNATLLVGAFDLGLTSD